MLNDFASKPEGLTHLKFFIKETSGEYYNMAMDRFYDADPDIQASQARIDYLKEVNDTLKEIIDNVKWRHQSIKNAIDWQKFTSGM